MVPKSALSSRFRINQFFFTSTQINPIEIFQRTQHTLRDMVRRLLLKARTLALSSVSVRHLAKFQTLARQHDSKEFVGGGPHYIHYCHDEKWQLSGRFFGFRSL